MLDQVIEEGVKVAIELDDENFEHETQAATGATTGDWFVLFYAPWCGHCKRFKPTWHQFADQVGHRINVAQVNVDESKGLAERFSIKGYPTLLFFKRGMYYKYMGNRTIEDMSTFAFEKYAELATESGKVPAELTTLDKVIKSLIKIYDEVILSFDAAFHMAGYGFLPAPAKILVSIIALTAPALILGILVLV